MGTIPQSEKTEERAGRLGMAIWLSLLPHTDMHGRPSERYRDEDAPPAEYRPTEVTSADQLRPGDLILVLDNNVNGPHNRRTMARRTAREAVRAHESAVRLVETVSNKSITAHFSIHLPTGGPGSCDPDKIGEPRFPVETHPAERLAVGAQRWTIARLGHVGEIAEGFRSHPDYDAWHAAYTAYRADQDAAAEDRRARVEIRDRRRAPLLAAIEEINTIAGETLVKIDKEFFLGPDEVGQALAANEWLAEGDRLRIYLSGLAHTKRWGVTEGLKIEQALKTLGLNGATK